MFSTFTAVPFMHTLPASPDQPGFASAPVRAASGAVQGKPVGGSQSL